MAKPINLKYWEPEVFKNWLDLYETILTDCDDVLWHENEVIAQVPETINTLKSLGKNLYFVTNNATKTRHDLWIKAHQMNYLIDESHIIAPTFSIAKYLQQHLNKKDKVYVIGNAAIKQELINFNIMSFGTETGLVHDNCGNQMEIFKRTAEVEQVGAVVVGFDEHYTFMKMLKACSFLCDKENCKFSATNSDAVHRYPKYCIPGTGAILKSLETCVGRKAVVMGKPNPIICQNLIKTGVINPKKSLMIGDCAKNDVLFGKNCGFDTLLVGTGNYTWPKVQSFIENKQNDFIPNYYLDSLGDLFAFLM